MAGDLTQEQLEKLMELSREASRPTVVIPEPIVTRRCFICDKPLKDSIDGNMACPISYPSDDAIMFTSRGNWGSTLFDPGNTLEQIEISICDLCVYERQHKVSMVITRDNQTFYECETFADHVKDWRNAPPSTC